MRVYALSGMNVVLALVTFALSFIPIALDLVRILQAVPHRGYYSQSEQVENIKWFQVQNLPQPFNCSPADVTPQGLLLMYVSPLFT